MKEFMDKDFLLETETAKHLFHDYAENMPIVDYHCHISPKEIYENKPFEDLAQAWFGGENPDGSFSGDHYKWRAMRFNGVEEKYITGNADGCEKLVKFAETLEMAIGNPMYHWSNLELKKYFGFEGHLSPENAKEVWNMTGEKLRNDKALTPRGLIEQSNVSFIGTTDDPVDSLEWHKKIAADKTVKFKVCPSFRPEKAFKITDEGFIEYMDALAKSVGKERFSSAVEVCAALTERLEYFVSLGCRASDISFDYIPYTPCSTWEVNAIFAKAMAGERVTDEEKDKYRTFMLLYMGQEYHRVDIAMQIHYSVVRSVNARAFKRMGPDTGFDMISHSACLENLARCLSALEENNACPRTIIYSLNPADNEQIGTLLGCFQSSEIPGKLQQGSAWWFSDTKSGMEAQMKSLANLGLLGNFVGMLTDSRSFLSYARHDYFRRIFCNLLGNWVENGEYPNDDRALKKIVEGVCCNNAVRFFKL